MSGQLDKLFLFNQSANFEVGDSLEVLNGVVVYYNESFGNVLGRNVTVMLQL